MGMLIEGNLHHKKFKRNKIKWNNHSLNRPTSPQLQMGGGGYGDFKMLNNRGCGWKNLSINGWVRHNGGVDLKIGG